MNKIIIALVAGVVGLSSLQVRADDGVKYSLDTSVAFNSAYVYRGTTMYDGSSIQPEAIAKADMGDMGTFYGSVWNHNSASNDTAHTERFTQENFVLGYEIPVDIITLGAGYEWYRFQNNNPGFANTQEYFLSAAVDTVLNPTLTYSRDIDAGTYNYYDLTFSEKIDEVCGLGEGFNVTPYVTFGFASSAAGVYEQGGLVQTTVGVSSDLALGDFKVVPSVNYSFESDAATDNQFWAGFSIGYSWL